MARIPKSLHEHINTAFPAHLTLVGTVQPDGYAQVTPRGSTLVYDDEHLSLWERGRGSTGGTRTGGTCPSIEGDAFAAALTDGDYDLFVVPPRGAGVTYPVPYELSITLTTP